MQLLLVGGLLALLALAVGAQAPCAQPFEQLQCAELGAGNFSTGIDFEGYSGAQVCAAVLPDPSLCVSPTQTLYEFDLFVQLDLAETGACTLQFSVDNVPLDGITNCDTTFCNGTRTGRCGYLTLSGLTIQLLVENVRYRKTLQTIGSFPYDTLEVTQLLQYTDLGNAAGAASALECSTVCASSSCSFRASDPTGTYCLAQNSGNFSAGFGPSQFNCVSVPQSVFVPGTPDLTASCCGDCENCLCPSVQYVPYYPQTSPVGAYNLFNTSAGAGFQLDASTGGLPGNTYNVDSPMFVSSTGWPFRPAFADQDYYESLVACPPAEPGCNHGEGLWLGALRRNPITPGQTLPSDIDGKLACGYCSQGMSALQACGDPAVPALVAIQTYAMGQSPICTAFLPVDDAVLEFDLVVTVTGRSGTVTTEVFLDLQLDGEQDLVVSGSEGTIFLVIEPNLQQSPLDDPLVIDSVWVACAPDSQGQDFGPLDPATWLGSESPWTGRTGPASGLPDCYGCLPDEQSEDPATPRLWWYMNATQAAAAFEFGNVGAPGRSGLANRVVQVNDCDNPVGDETGCAAGTFVGLQSLACSQGGIGSLLPRLTPASVGRAFNAYRRLLADSTTKAIDPLTTDAGLFLPPFYNYAAPNVWLETSDSTMTVVYRPLTSPFENTVQQELDMAIFVDTALAGPPVSVPPLVAAASGSVLYLCALSNVNPPREAFGTVTVYIPPAFTPPSQVNYAFRASVGGSFPCLLNGDESLEVFMQTESLALQVSCNATDLALRINPGSVFTLTASHGNVVSLVYSAVVCSSLAQAEADPYYVPPPALNTSIGTLQSPTEFTVPEDLGTGSRTEYVDSLYSSQRVAVIFWCCVIVIGPGILAIISLTWMVFLLIREEVRIRRFERS